MVFEIKILSDDNALKENAEAWRALSLSCQGALFSEYDYFDLWLHDFDHKKSQPFVVAAYEDGVLVGLMPLVCQRKMGLKFLLWAGNDLFDYCGTLAISEEVRKLLWTFVRSVHDYDLAVLFDVEPTSKDAAILKDFSETIILNRAYFMDVVWKDVEEKNKKIARRQRKKLKTTTKKLKALGEVSVKTIEEGPVDITLVREMVRQKIMWCLQNKKKGVFLHENMPQVFHRMIETASKKKKICLAYMMCGDQPVSFLAGFVEDKILKIYFTSYDLSFHDCSPGVILMDQAFNWAIDHDLSTVDFMRGEEEYKRKYATGVRDLTTYIFGHGVKGAILAFLLKKKFFLCQRLKRAIKGLLMKFPSSVQKRIKAFFS